MLTFIFAVLLGALMFGAISLLKTYRHVPMRELKRQANQGDDVSKLFYRVVAFDASLDALLWTFIGISSAAFFVLISKQLSWPLSLAAVATSVWFGFTWLPGSHISRPGVMLARVMAKPLVTVLEWVHTPFVKIARTISKFRPVTVHTGLYTKDDLLEFIDLQKSQIDNRISKNDLGFVTHALLMSDKKVADIMTPWKKVKKVATHDMVGPILMDELHAGGHTHFPVFEGSDKKNIVGILDIADMLAAKAGGFVKDIMMRRIYYLHENEKVSEAFTTFAETKHPLFMVISDREELVGILSLSEVLKQMLGELGSPGFEHHSDRAAVSKKRQPKVTHFDAELKVDANGNESPDEPKPEAGPKTETKPEK